MRTGFKKALSIMIGFIVAVVCVCCGPSTVKPGGENEIRVDPTKTQLYVSNFNGAYGQEWLLAAAKRFEDKWKDESFETGKKGVQVVPDNNKTTGSEIINRLASTSNDVFFTERVYYNDLVASGNALDITDIVTEKLTEYGETRSIFDKLTPQQQEYYNVGGRYYAVPHYQGFRGITYDVDMFTEEGFYFEANPDLDADANKINTYYENGNDGFVTSEDAVKSNGPDGKPNTYDDGLPATYDEFFMLCAKIADAGYTPCIYTGSNQVYFTEFLSALAADYEGLDDMMLNFTYYGTAHHLVEVDENGKVKFGSDGEPILRADTEIKPSNGYELSAQAGKYYALKFAERLIRGGYLDSRSFGTLSHTDTQKAYAYSRFNSSTDIAMLIESNYWENEASDMNVFSAMEKQWPGKAGRMDRKFAMMPFPKATEAQVGEDVTIIEYQDAAGFIRKNIPDYKKELALDFLQFVCTDESLVEFTKITGCTRAFKYDVPSEVELSNFSKSVLDMMERGSIVNTFSTTELFRNNAAALDFTHYWTTRINYGQGDMQFNTPGKDIHDDPKITAINYFEGTMKVKSKEFWNSFRAYFEK